MVSQARAGAGDPGGMRPEGTGTLGCGGRGEGGSRPLLDRWGAWPQSAASPAPLRFLLVATWWLFPVWPL